MTIYYNMMYFILIYEAFNKQNRFVLTCTLVLMAPTIIRVNIKHTIFV